MNRFAVAKFAAIVGLGMCVLTPSIPQVPEASILTPDAAMDPLAKECLAKITPAIEKSGGQLTPDLRKAYVDWCWATVTNSLRAHHQIISEASLDEVAHDPVLKDAVSAAVFPPDPSILQNYDTLHTKLGATISKKYRSLLLGVALARRVKGVETNPNDEVGQENQVPIWAYNPLARPGSEAERQFIGHIADFMKSRDCSARILFNSDDLRSKLKDYLTGSQVEKKYVDEVSRTPQFGERLKNAMIVLGQRPPDRTSKPDCVDWIKRLISTYESSPSSTPNQMSWPLFTVNSAPWPLLMPFSHAVPMDEAKYLWETFQGEHGEDRYHTYGPYRDDLAAMPDSLLPSHWFWNAVPDQIVHGGECMPISLATIDLYASLCKPASDACQPGHANLISYQNRGGTWTAEVEQDFAGGARVTQSQWFFGDPARGDLHFQGVFGWPGAEYHLGLAVGMNLGVTSYIDTRIASRICDVLPAAARKTIGLKLLSGAIQENPFNPEVWYRICGITSDALDGLALVQDVKNHDPKRIFHGLPCMALETFLKSGMSAAAGGNMDLYWKVLQENIGRFAVLAKGAPADEIVKHNVFAALSAIPGIEPAELSAFTQRFTLKSQAQTLLEASADLKLADQGDSFGCLRMGERYLDGDGVPRDEVKAREFLLKAAVKGDPTAALALESINIPLSNDGVETVASSNYGASQDVKHLLDGSGMTGGVHDNSYGAFTMWQTVDNPQATVPAPGLPASPAWVKFTFPQPRTFDAVEIWNHNQVNLTDRGFKKFEIYGSFDGKRWFGITHHAELPRADGTPFEPCVTVPTTSAGLLLKSVIIAAAATDGNYGSADYGLSAVRFVTHPIISTVPAYQIECHASGQFSDTQSPNHLIDGTGMTGEFHDNNGSAGSMWHTTEHPIPTLAAPTLYRSPAWVRFNFSIPRYFEAIRIWNLNQQNLTNRGFKTMRIYGTSDGIEWFLLTATDDIQLPQASGAPLIGGATFFSVCPERPIRAVMMIADPRDGNYGGSCYGLSAVRFIVPSSPPVTALTAEATPGG